MAKDHGPSIKDDETYQALRDEGASKEKAARIANAQAAGSTDQDSRPYEKRTKDELYKQAQEIGIEGRSDMSKAELIDALRNH
ncbi:MAG: Rho termination factor N-terminal domain-containing protein [Pacificimonas sp.]